IPHTVVDVGQGDGADKLKRLTGGLDAPALQVGDQYATGFNESRWQTLLDDAGYPKTPPPRTAPVGKAPAPASEPAPTTQTVTPPASGGYPQWGLWGGGPPPRRLVAARRVCAGSRPRRKRRCLSSSPPGTSIRSTCGCRGCSIGWPPTSPTSSACRKPSSKTPGSRPWRSRPQATRRTSTGSGPITASPSCRDCPPPTYLRTCPNFPTTTSACSRRRS